MRIIAAPDSYKGSLSALEAAGAIEKGVLSVFPEAQVDKVPVADGGEGTAEALVTASGGRLLRERVMGPLGEPVEAYWGLLGDGRTGVIETAAASGLPLVPADRRNPALTTTYGTGELIRAALEHGVRKLIIGLGGSATNDGGAGLLQALGVRFLDGAGEELPQGGAALARLARIDAAGLDPRLAECAIRVACDVDNPLCGPRGASAVFGPQKGASMEMVAQLDSALQRFAEAAHRAAGRQAAELPGAGAAGGLGAGLLYFTEAELTPGIRLVLEAAEFERKLQGADLVITGEGATDAQTAFGKAPVGVAQIARQYGVPVVCLSGSLGPGSGDVLEQGIGALMSIVPGPMPLQECIASAPVLVEEAAARLCRLLRVGMKLGGAERSR
ncbi:MULTISPECIES: glycerate kinase [Paenibacillus]|uniref:glycerate kinase n=1 Tax=Paenibacillus TaxID=44249 RepID=UPI0022B85CC5|nr:glycerate kinase [Paenibacillus caseinilyticus]MCZ8518471.1 glycerate kinase [Paenibacillus caseinilyticus]